MGSDMVVALGRATAAARALFGHNALRPSNEVQMWVREPARVHAADEHLQLRHVLLPQVRQTVTVLGSRPTGLWGYQSGVNEYGVAVGLTRIHTRLRCDAPGLEGHELTRLALERATSARKAVDVISDLVSRYGQGSCEEGASGDNDNGFLIADGEEAFVLEAAGRHWALQEVREVRAVCSMCHLHQDWDRISPGLAQLLIERQWWPEDGNKVDFADAVGLPGEDHVGALRRWGRATVRLEEHNGRIDPAFLRRLLSSTEDHLCRVPSRPDDLATATSLIAEAGLCEDDVGLAWCGFGPPSLSLYFPVCIAGELPAAFSDPRQQGLWRQLRRMRAGGAELQRGMRSLLSGLQIRFDMLAREFKDEARELRRRGEAAALGRLAESFMEHIVERFEEGCYEATGTARLQTAGR